MGDAREAVGDALGIAERLAPRPAASVRHRLACAQPQVLARLRIAGRSLGPAALVSAVALWTRRRVKPGTAITGLLAGENLTSAGGLAEKIEAAIEGRADVRRFIVPAADEARVRAVLRAAGRGPGERGAHAATAIEEQGRAATATEEQGLEVIGVADVRALVAAALEPEAVEQDPDVVVERLARETNKGWYGFRWPLLQEPLERQVIELPAARTDLRVKVWTLLATARRNAGAPEGGLAALGEARALARSSAGRRSVPDAVLVPLHVQRAQAQRQLGRFEEAARDAGAAVEVARRARLRGDLLLALGTAGIVASSRARHAEAEKLFREAVEVAHEHRPAVCVRSHGYAIEALARRGRLAAARVEHRRAVEHLERVSGKRRASQEGWLCTSWGGALVGCGRDEEAIEVLDTPEVHARVLTLALPGITARRHLGVALARSGRDPERGWALLAETPAAYGPALAPHLVFLAHVNVIAEGASRLAHGGWNADIAGRVGGAMGYLPRGRAGRFLRVPKKITANALAELVERCLALG
jgi:tetratricopeptide (TPR) repeat protein